MMSGGIIPLVVVTLILLWLYHQIITIASLSSSASYIEANWLQHTNFDVLHRIPH
jgi:hypothetical protein